MRGGLAVVDVQLRLHDEPLRTCTPVYEHGPYPWLHPGPADVGKNVGIGGGEVSSWLVADLESLFDCVKERGQALSDYVFSYSLGEIAEMLDRAGYGELEEDSPESHWRKVGGDDWAERYLRE